MLRLRILFILISLITWNYVDGQVKKSKSARPELSIINARDLMTVDPVKGTAMVRNIIRNARKQEDFSKLSAAYDLLGDSYTDIQQYTLAANRYNEAIFYTPKDQNNTIQHLLLKQGNAYLSFDPSLAKISFQNCINYEGSASIRTNCMEGLADVLSKQGSNQEALDIYQNLYDNFQFTDSLDAHPRLQFKLANQYSILNQPGPAVLNFNNAQLDQSQNYLGENTATRSAYEDASEQIIQLKDDVSEEIQIRQFNIESNPYDADFQATERIKLAEAYLKTKDDKLALRTLKIAENEIGKETAPEIKAKINKKTAELYTAKGDYKNALDYLSRYDEQRDSIVKNKMAELDQQIDLVQNQISIDLDEKEYINTSSRQAYERSQLVTQKIIIGLLSVLLLLALISIWIILKNNKEKKRANQLLELRGLRSQMNPHFLFNALNTVNEYIILQDERKANQYLSDFAGLMRMLLEHSKADFIPLQDEIDFSRRYLELEHRRFDDKFDLEIEINEDMLSHKKVPPLLFQPYIENAIWHGLRYRNEKGMLRFTLQSIEGALKLVIEDNGIGRTLSQEVKTKNQKIHRSTGLQNTQRRMQLIRQLYGQQIDVILEDAFPEETNIGTRVIITIQ